MDESLSHWLRLRERADAAARSAALTRVIADTLPAGERVCVLDLATGGGSNVRFLADCLPGPQRWLAVDRSAVLLAGLREQMSAWGLARGLAVQTDADGCRMQGVDLQCDVETRQMDLGPLDRHEIFAGRHLVTASALLDLVSARWLEALAAHCQEERASALFTITYNGRFSCVPPEAEDRMVRDLMNQHQKRDKGLGEPATGPDATASAERWLRGGGVPGRACAERLGARADGAGRAAGARRWVGGRGSRDGAGACLGYHGLAGAPANTYRCRSIATDCRTRRSRGMAAGQIGDP